MKIEIWSDVTCTHCYTAKRKFESALAQFKNRDRVEIVWRSFELAPGLKTDPNKFLPQFLQELHGTTVERVQAMIDQVTDAVKEVGLEYHLNKAIPANSFNAHRLSHFAKAQGLQGRMEERMFKAYFQDGKNIDDIPTLIDLANEVGLNTTEVKNMLESARYADEVNQDLREARDGGITSVPQYVFNGNTRLSGAKESEVYLETLEREFAKWESADGQSCKIGEDCF